MSDIELTNINILIGRQNVDKNAFYVFLNDENIKIYNTSFVARTTRIISNQKKIQIESKTNEKVTLDENFEPLATFLYFLYINYPKTLQRIEREIHLIEPYFQNFTFDVVGGEDKEVIFIKWVNKNKNDNLPMRDLSSGTQRFICLATLLMQPVELMPSIIIIDEPELGLHPYTLAILAGLIKTASNYRKIIISTQSPELLNHFSIDDVIVAERTDVGTSFKRLKKSDYKEWLEDYSLGQLWVKNILGGN